MLFDTYFIFYNNTCSTLHPSIISSYIKLNLLFTFCIYIGELAQKSQKTNLKKQIEKHLVDQNYNDKHNKSIGTWSYKYPSYDEQKGKV
jgi:hypothetical protein